jgi:hypothetical protein
MIAYDLECAQGHGFEGWFDGAEGFEDQSRKGQITCPVCGSPNVTRVLSTFGIARRREEPAAPKTDGPNPLVAVARYIRDNFENVGAEFAKEALKMHYGVSEHRNIRGVSSAQEEETLKQEGVSFFKFPLPADKDPEDQ